MTTLEMIFDSAVLVGLLPPMMIALVYTATVIVNVLSGRR